MRTIQSNSFDNNKQPTKYYFQDYTQNQNIYQNTYVLVCEF